MTVMHRLSRIFQPVTMFPKSANLTNKDVTSKSQRLMLELGIIHQCNPGCFHFLPLGLKSLNKLIQIVDEEMETIGGQKLMFPSLVKSELWHTSGRVKDMGSELMILQDRHQQEYILAPTHEETASHLLSTLAPISHKHFPLLLYQITSKYRDEMKPRFGLIRGREFLMKDMYSFDLNMEKAMETYENISRSYDRIFNRIGIDFVKVLGNLGAMGGNLSHEYHFLDNLGEDKILSCKNCNYMANTSLSGEQKCPSCGESSNITIQKGTEVGHTFLLGDKYSKPLNAKYINQSSRSEVLQMGSYGIGISRLLAASLEVLSLEQELRWPDCIAPYNVVIILPKKGSKEERGAEHLSEKLYKIIQTLVPVLKNSILLDDRVSFTIGRRFLDAKRSGYRYIIVINKRSVEDPPIYEFNDIYKNQQFYFNESDVVKYIKENTKILT